MKTNSIKSLKYYVPLDKSWTIRMGVLDLLYGNSDDTLIFLKGQQYLSDDILALVRIAPTWKNRNIVDVGESGTLYRFLQFASWKLGLGKQFVQHGTLTGRSINQDPKVVYYSLEKLLTLDHGTSQWASAAILLGSTETIPEPPYKLQLTYEAVAHWKQRCENHQPWELRYDPTILRQANAYIGIINGEKSSFMPQQSEDYCFARAFGVMTAEEGERRWPSLRGHETDRLEEMEIALMQLNKGTVVQSADHRVIQAVSMLAKTRNQAYEFASPNAVNKSWPQFWSFLTAPTVTAA